MWTTAQQLSCWSNPSFQVRWTYTNTLEMNCVAYSSCDHINDLRFFQKLSVFNVRPVVNEVQFQHSGSEFSKAFIKFLKVFRLLWLHTVSHEYFTGIKKKHGKGTFKLLQRNLQCSKVYTEAITHFWSWDWMNKCLSLLLDKAPHVFKINGK